MTEAALPQRNRRFTLRERPVERINASTFEIDESPIAELADGEALVRIDWISLDPTNRTWLYDEPTYLPPVGIGEVMRALVLGEVVASRTSAHPVGQTVQGFGGWQDYAVISEATPMSPVQLAPGVSPSTYLGALGMTGLTAWAGIREIAKPRPGETVVVSAAAGAVGSVAGQLAKAAGACRWHCRRAREVRAAHGSVGLRCRGGLPSPGLGRLVDLGDTRWHRRGLRKRRRGDHE